jgi:hypothetical protein
MELKLLGSESLQRGACPLDYAAQGNPNEVRLAWVESQEVVKTAPGKGRLLATQSAAMRILVVGNREKEVATDLGSQEVATASERLTAGRTMRLEHLVEMCKVKKLELASQLLIR